jgi:hypothetical protein
MRARFAGWCKVCRERIAPGEEIDPATAQEGWQHVSCPVTQGLSSARSPRLHVARQGVTGGRRSGHTRGIRKIT